jgi:hypothetical protein
MADVTFNHWTLGGKYERLELLDDYPCPSVPDYLNEFYLFKLGYYSHELIFHTIFHRHRPDFTEMVLHHFVTVVLVFFSYTTNQTKIGAIVLLCHGFSDIWTANMKIMYEFSGKVVQLLCYSMMLGSFVYTRIYVFPFVIIWQYYLR